MKPLKTFLAVSAFAACSLVAMAGSHGAKASMDIVDTAVNAGDFGTLVTAVQEAGLVDTLKGEGPYTVFPPNDAAFAKIPPAQLEALLADKAALTKVLTYHVVPGRVMAADVVTLTSADTVEGQSIAIDTSDGVKVNGATVIATDIGASNGVIHVIDSVIMPPDMALGVPESRETLLASAGSHVSRNSENDSR